MQEQKQSVIKLASPKESEQKDKTWIWNEERRSNKALQKLRKEKINNNTMKGKHRKTIQLEDINQKISAKDGEHKRYRTFVGYLMPESSLLQNSFGTIQ